MPGKEPAFALNINDMFRPPIDHSMRVLNREFFKKTVTLAAARVLENKHISPCRTSLRHDLLNIGKHGPIRSDPLVTDSRSGRKAILLRPEIKAEDSSTWSENLRELESEKKVSVTPFKLELTYNDWDYSDIMGSILPEDDQEELPSGFSIVGHIAHLNLRSKYLQYKHVIANVLMDKNTGIRTVINKVEDVGTQNEYRTFQYELLAGDPSLETEIRELNCRFRFDYAKVYWNSRLNTEHERLIDKFEKGDVICDVMAGVGPFAVPAGKKQIFVWANDLNPESYKSLVDAITLNKVSNFVRPFNEDGRDFVRKSAKMLLEEDLQVNVTPKPRRSERNDVLACAQAPKDILTQAKVFNHYIMNLPATATTFLDTFIGLYHGRETEFHPNTKMKLPMVHVYCFSTKSDDNAREVTSICQEVSKQIGFIIKPEDDEVEIWNVRDVAPHKRMFCATFRLPQEVAFR